MRNVLGQSPSAEHGFDRLSDKAYNKLRYAIAEGQLVAGTRLKEIELCKKLGMGRSPVREALLRLAADGLVDVIPKAGYFVRHLTLPDIEEAYHIRARLECLAVCLACQRGFPRTNLVEMERICDRLHAASLKEDHRASALEDLQFHQALIALAGSPRLSAAIRSSQLQVFAWNLRSSPVTPREDDERVLTEHRQILKCLEARDHAQAEQVLNRHILAALDMGIMGAPDKGGPSSSLSEMKVVGNLIPEAKQPS